MIYTYNASDFIVNKVRRVIFVVAAHQKVGIERSLLDGEHEISAGLHVGIADYIAPKLHAVREHDILRR